MSVKLLATSALATAAGAIAKQIYPVLLDDLKKRGEGKLRITLGDIQLNATREDADDIIRQLQSEIESAKKASAGTLGLTRKAVAPEAKGTEDRALSREPGTGPEGSGRAAFSISPEAVIRDARRRIDLVFRFNLSVAIALAVVLIGGIAAAVVMGVVFRQPSWSLIFAGVSAADIIGIYVYKPLDAVNAAIVATQRLDAINLRLREQLNLCLQYTELRDRIECQTKLWEAVQDELAALAAT